VAKGLEGLARDVGGRRVKPLRGRGGAGFRRRVRSGFSGQFAFSGVSLVGRLQHFFSVQLVVPAGSLS
jgi:hypothetical protein